jgi:hypothetical protein
MDVEDACSILDLGAAVILRDCQAEDGVAMWRAARDTGDAPLGASPFLYLAMATRRGRCCAVAERDGELVGFAVVQPPLRSGGAAQIICVCVTAHAGEIETAFALVAHQLARPGYRTASAVKLGPDCPSYVRTMCAGFSLPTAIPHAIARPVPSDGLH